MLGRALLTLDSAALLGGAIAADWNHTHLFNPRWPPHAKFHDAQTIQLAVVLGAATAFYTWRPAASPALQLEYLRVAGFTGSIYWLTGLASILFPNTAGIDPEFGTGFPQLKVFTPFALLGIAGSLLASWSW